MPVRKIRSQPDAEKCLNAVTRSGLSRLEWCHAHDIDGRSLRAWDLKLGGERHHGSGSFPRLVEVVAATSEMAPVQPLVVRVGDFRIDIPVGFDPRTLASLLGVLAAC